MFAFDFSLCYFWVDGNRKEQQIMEEVDKTKDIVANNIQKMGRNLDNLNDLNDKSGNRPTELTLQRQFGTVGKRV